MAMTSRQRLMATLRGEVVDRPAVSFYEVGGLPANPDDPDPYNVYNDPSWRALLDLAEHHTDLIRMRGPATRARHREVRNPHFDWQEMTEGLTRWSTLRVKVCGRELVQVQRRDAAVNTVWTIEHLLKSEEDVRAYLELPDEALESVVDCRPITEAEREVGERGIIMVDTADPLCLAAALMSMEDYTVLAMTEPALFHQLLEKVARPLYEVVETVARECPSHLWRIYGPEYASEPYLPPALFGQYVVRYGTPIVKMIQRYGGYARIHCHGRLRSILPMIASMGADGLDPIEPPPQGDVELRDVRREYGKQMVLFGNLEAADLENLETSAFARRVDQAIREGTAGGGRGFVLMPSACPYGRTITARTLANYRCMLDGVGAG